MMTVFRQALLCLLLLWLPVSGRLNPAGCVHPITITPACGYALIRPQAAKLVCCWMLNWRTAGKPTGVRRAREASRHLSPGKGKCLRSTGSGQPLHALRSLISRPEGYHDNVTFPMVVRGRSPATLSGVLTLSTCSNVCLLTDFPFSVTSTTRDPTFAHDYAQAMGQIPLASGLTDTLRAGARAGELVVEAHRAGGWTAPGLYLDAVDDADFGMPQIHVAGETLRATVPVHDGWGKARRIYAVSRSRWCWQITVLPRKSSCDWRSPGY